jgi:hypothetical protein
MVLKKESRLNGVKTNIFNLDEVAKALIVPEEGSLYSLTLFSYYEVLVRRTRSQQGEEVNLEG